MTKKQGNRTNTNDFLSNENATRRLVDIESYNRLTSDSIGELSDKPDLLKSYLDASLGQTFSKLMFRLTHDKYTEKKSSDLWHQIVKHRAGLKKKLSRDVVSFPVK